MSTLQIGDDNPRIRYEGDGVNLTFTFNFPIFDEKDIEVYFGEEKQTSGFDIIKSQTEYGGKIVFYTPPKPNIIITITRNLEIKRTTDFSESQAFRAKMLNHEFDYLVACLKQINGNLDRSISLPIYTESGIDLELPIPNSGKALIWGEDGKSIRNSLINIEDLDSYVSAAEELKHVAEIAQEMATQMNSVLSKVDEAVTLSNTAQNLLPEKLDLDLGNINDNGVKLIQTYLTPDYNSGLDISFLSSIDTFEAPANGIISMLVCADAALDKVSIMINNAYIGGSLNSAAYVSNRSAFFFPISKNDILSITALGNIGTKEIIFFPYKEI